MKATIAGVTIDVAGSAWFATFGRSTPIFHAWAPPDEDGARTRCGLQLSRTTSGAIAFLMTGLPPRLAVRVGRPCVKCWPELRRQQALFTDQRRRRREPAGEQLEEAL